MASTPPPIADAFRKLQAGDPAGAFDLAQRVLAADPSNARAHLAAGIALRMAGRLDEAALALQRARQVDPRDHAAAYEEGIVCQLQGRGGPALECFERCAQLRPDFFAAPFSAGLLHAERGEWGRAAERFRAVLALQPGQPEAQLQLAIALGRDGRHEEAEAAFVQALATNPSHAGVIRAFGQYAASRGNFRRAASLFAESARLEPDDAGLSMYLAQCELHLGRWAPAWAAYARRPSRQQFQPYLPPAPSALRGARVTVVGEQGLGDVLFFLRWAPLLREAGATLEFAGEPRLNSLLARTGLFESLEASADSATMPVLVADLPALFSDVDPLARAALRIAPLPDRLARWESTLQSLGPRPWIGASWRAGTSHDVAANALSKQVPVDALFAALAKTKGTLIALQRGATAAELDAATRAAGRPVHDLSRANEDLEDLLAVVTLLDRHVAVSSTTMHLAASAGAVADVLVPFPPEWRWRLDGNSPWFPGFRVHRQGMDGDWSAALASAVRGA